MSTEKLFTQQRVQMNTQDILMVDRWHTLEAFFQVTRVVVNYREGQKFKKKPTSEDYIARTTTYDRAYPEKLATSPPGEPVGVTEPSLIRLFVQQDKKSLKILRKPK